MEMVLAEKARRRKLDQRACATNEVAAGIDAFEMTLKRLGGPAEGPAGGSSKAAAAAAAAAAPAAGGGGDSPPRLAGLAGQSPVATLNAIRQAAPSPDMLAAASGEYLATIQARRKEELAARKEREVRSREGSFPAAGAPHCPSSWCQRPAAHAAASRRHLDPLQWASCMPPPSHAHRCICKPDLPRGGRPGCAQVRRRRLVAEQAGAHTSADSRAGDEALLHLLARQSQEEQQLAARLWQVRPAAYTHAHLPATGTCPRHPAGAVAPAAPLGQPPASPPPFLPPSPSPENPMWLAPGVSRLSCLPALAHRCARRRMPCTRHACTGRRSTQPARRRTGHTHCAGRRRCTGGGVGEGGEGGGSRTR